MATSLRIPNKRWMKVVLILSGVAAAAAIGVIVYLRYFYGKDAPAPFELSSIAVVIPRRRRHRRAGITVALVLAATSVVAAPAQARAKAAAVGGSCPKAGSTATAGGTTLSCRLVGKKKRWTAVPSSATVTVSASKTTVAPTNAEPATPAADAAIEGTYNIGAGSAAGYRVREIFVGGLAKVDAVGRSEAVTGSVVLGRTGKGIQLQSVTAAIDTTKLKSDESRRDNQMKSIGLETNKFPTATFTSSTSVSLDAAAESGQPVSATVPGKLTLHGVTRDVQVGVDAQLRSGTMEIVGRVAITMKDYSIDPPEIADFVKADADGMLEFKLVLKKA